MRLIARSYEDAAVPVEPTRVIPEQEGRQLLMLQITLAVAYLCDPRGNIGIALPVGTILLLDQKHACEAPVYLAAPLGASHYTWYEVVKEE